MKIEWENVFDSKIFWLLYIIQSLLFILGWYFYSQCKNSPCNNLLILSIIQTIVFILLWAIPLYSNYESKNWINDTNNGLQDGFWGVLILIIINIGLFGWQIDLYIRLKKHQTNVSQNEE